MKAKHILLVFLIFWINSMFAQKISPQQAFVDTLKKSFPEGTVFVYHDRNEEIPKDTLSYEFHLPEVAIINDTLHLSYVEIIKEDPRETTIELVKQTVPLKCIEEISTFNFTFGAYDRFEPALTYLGLWTKEENCHQSETFSLPQDRWRDYKQFKITRIWQDSWHGARFPAKLTKNELRKLKKHLKTLQQ